MSPNVYILIDVFILVLIVNFKVVNDTKLTVYFGNISVSTLYNYEILNERNKKLLLRLYTSFNERFINMKHNTQLNRSLKN